MTSSNFRIFYIRISSLKMSNMDETAVANKIPFNDQKS